MSLESIGLGILAWVLTYVGVIAIDWLLAVLGDDQ